MGHRSAYNLISQWAIGLVSIFLKLGCSGTSGSLEKRLLAGAVFSAFYEAPLRFAGQLDVVRGEVATFPCPTVISLWNETKQVLSKDEWQVRRFMKGPLALVLNGILFLPWRSSSKFIR